MANDTLLAQTPGLEPPPGITPNFENPPSIQSISYAVSAICLFITTLAVGLRIFTKIRVDRNLKLEDYASVFSWLCFIAYTGLVLTNTISGVGRHQWDVPILNVVSIFRITSYIDILYGPLIFAAKLSILLQFKRIFVPRQKNVIYWCIYIIIWLNLLFYLIDTFVVAFACSPREKIWNPTIPGHCVNNNLNFVVTGICNIVSDFSILLLPLYSIWLLQLPFKKKLAVSAIFATGLFACISSILRLVYTVILLNTADTTYVILQIGLWTLAEITSVIICGTLPVLSKLLKFLSTERLKYTYQQTTTNKGFPGKYAIPSTSTRSGTTVWSDPEDPAAQLIHSDIALTECKVFGQSKPSDNPFSIKGDVNGTNLQQPLAGIRKTVRMESDAPSDLSSSQMVPEAAHFKGQEARGM
ncbi:hypothetical protein MMC14_010672 [Varicellaria rhodocarpa]|nr:hypothetical protein [Varicellaria rhodocarpa]